MTQNMITVTNAAKRLGLYRRTVLKQIYKGHLGAYKQGGKWLVPENELDRFARLDRKPGNLSGRPRTGVAARRLGKEGGWGAKSARKQVGHMWHWEDGKDGTGQWKTHCGIDGGISIKDAPHWLPKPTRRSNCSSCSSLIFGG